MDSVYEFRTPKRLNLLADTPMIVTKAILSQPLLA